MSKENKQLRQLLAEVLSGPRLYCDDGELQDNSRWPCIDFKRDPVEELLRKMKLRAKKALQEARDTTWIPRPDSAGWWWRKGLSGKVVNVVQIQEEDGKLFADDWLIEAGDCEWSGPIEPPFDVRTLYENTDNN